MLRNDLKSLKYTDVIDEEEEKPQTEQEEKQPPKRAFDLGKVAAFFSPRPIYKTSRLYKIWGAFIFLIHAYEIIFAPFLFAWTEHFLSYSWIMLSLAIDLFYIVDTYIQSHCVIKDNYGKDILDLKVLRRRYLLKEGGVVTLIVSIPWDLMAFFAVEIGHTMLKFGGATLDDK